MLDPLMNASPLRQACARAGVGAVQPVRSGQARDRAA